MYLVSLALRGTGHDRTAERLFSSQLTAQSAQLPLIYASAPASDEMGFPPPGPQELDRPGHGGGGQRCSHSAEFQSADFGSTFPDLAWLGDSLPDRTIGGNLGERKDAPRPTLKHFMNLSPGISPIYEQDWEKRQKATAVSGPAPPPISSISFNTRNKKQMGWRWPTRGYNFRSLTPTSQACVHANDQGGPGLTRLHG